MEILELKEKIYSSKTKKYFNEVEKSFYDGNYRSATVMLYSVVIADVLYKLEELRDLYQDSAARDILKNINSRRDNINSEWEMNLLDEVKKKTEIIDDITFANLKFLKNLRNFSAHPAFDSSNELITPSRETILGLIQEMLKQILIRPPMYASKIISLILTDISEKKGLFIKDEIEFEAYLNNKYLNRIGEKMKQQLFKSFWKLVFKLDDDNCNSNRNINYMFIKIFFKQNKLLCLEEMKKEKTSFSQISNSIEINSYLIELMYQIPEIYEILETTTITMLQITFIERPYYNLIAYYQYGNIQDFINSIKANQLTNPSYIKMLEDYIKREKRLVELCDKYIEIIKESSTFNEADRLYLYTISNNLGSFSKKQIISLIQAINDNSQLNKRGRAYIDNNEIIEKCAILLGANFDYSKYKNFKFSQEVLENNSLPF